MQESNPQTDNQDELKPAAELQSDLEQSAPQQQIFKNKFMFGSLAILAVIILFLLFLNAVKTAPGKTLVVQNAVQTTPRKTSGVPKMAGNPFGVMLGNNTPTEVAIKLGVTYYRPISLFLDRWNGTCDECDRAKALGLKLVLTVRNNGGNRQPSTPPRNMNSYRDTLGKVLDTYKPALLAVENEENSNLFYEGTPAEYLAELSAACAVAHEKGIKCTNGGLVSSLVALLVADNYREAGDINKATDYINRTLGPKLKSQFGGVSASNIFSNPRVVSQLTRGKKLLAGYKKGGADYVNFHWYIADTQALAEAVAYLERVTGLKATTNEIGQQRNVNPEQVTAVMGKVVELGLPHAVWFSIDIPGYGEARGLVEKDGTLRPNGVAFRDFIQKTYYGSD